MWRKILDVVEIVGATTVVIVVVLMVAAIVLWFMATANGKNPFQ